MQTGGWAFGETSIRVEPGGSCARQRVFGLQNPELLSVFVDHPHRTNADLIVDAQGFCYVFTSKRKKALPEQPHRGTRRESLE